MPAMSQHSRASSWVAEVGWKHVGQRKAEVSPPRRAFRLVGCGFVPRPQLFERKKCLMVETVTAFCPRCSMHVLFSETP